MTITKHFSTYVREVKTLEQALSQLQSSITVTGLPFRAKPMHKDDYSWERVQQMRQDRHPLIFGGKQSCSK